jgi:putative integral membrane protein (TIGR02587 family)
MAAGIDRDPHGWRQEGLDLLRGLAAGSIVGMPLLFTMEMWWHGMTLSEGHLLALLAASLLVNFVFCYFWGFRATYSAREAASESVTSVAIGMLFSLGVLALIREVRFDEAWSEIIGKVLIEAAPVSLGVSFANAHIRNKSRTGEEPDNGGNPGGGGEGGAAGDARPGTESLEFQLKQDLRDLGATFTGATLFAYNVAPTEEVIMIASRIPAWQHLLVVAASLALGYAIVFASGFKERQVHVPGFFQKPLVETVMVYAASLLVAFALLYLVGVPGAVSNTSLAVKSTVTLGLVASVGGAAGRLVA